MLLARVGWCIVVVLESAALCEVICQLQLLVLLKVLLWPFCASDIVVGRKREMRANGRICCTDGTVVELQ